MDGWDLALLGIAGYLAAMGLVRLMIRRRNQLAEQLAGHSQRQGPQASRPAEPEGVPPRDKAP